ncbi:MAG: flippase-like domain-containing protein [Candidatus Aminicenantes bacterium]|nr:flippase-like domain-containing protein [Candidatus Aminicenantes bacterium]
MKKVVTNILIPVLVTAVVVYFFFSDISLRDIKINFLKIPFFYLLIFVLLSLLGTLLRAVRYYILLSKKLRFRDVFLITLVRNFSVDLLPARTASLVFYSYLTNKRGLTIEEGAASFVVAVFYDGLALCLMLGMLLFFLETEIHRAAIYTSMGFIFVISVVMVFFSDSILKFLLKIKILSRFPKVEKFFQNIYTYLTAHKKNSERLIVFVLSFFIRLIKYVFVYILFEGLVRIGFSLHHFSLFSFGLAGTELSSLIPIQGLGGFGTWELAFSLIFKALEIPAANLKEAGFVIHIVTQVWEYSIGIAALVYLFIKGGGNQRLRRRNSG